MDRQDQTVASSLHPSALSFTRGKLEGEAAGPGEMWGDLGVTEQEGGEHVGRKSQPGLSSPTSVTAPA